jgi:hypothetical protein
MSYHVVVSARTDQLDRMTDLEAQASLEAEFPGWMIHRAANHLCYASNKTTDQRDHLRGEDWADLRDQLIREIWRSTGEVHET